MSRPRDREELLNLTLDGVGRAEESLTSATAAKPSRPRIVIAIDHFLPGTNAGGPVRTVAATVEQLGDEFEFVVVTGERDRGDRVPYPRLKQGAAFVGRSQVHYLPPARMRPLALAALLEQLRPQALCLNGVFARTSRNTLLARKAGRIRGVPVLLAPRGDFSSGALAFKRTKKTFFLRVARASGLYRGVLWHASSGYEEREIRAALGPGAETDGSRIVVARDLVPRQADESRPARGVTTDRQLPSRPVKRRGAARIVFLSRIARKTHLDGAIKLLAGTEGEIEFEIFGLIEDPGYWRECERLLAQLPPNVHARYLGAAPPEGVTELLAGHHLLFFPTRGENFGHVILEALRAGCPVLVSDQTPWRGLASRRVGWDLPLAAPESFRAAIGELVGMDGATFAEWSERAREFGAACAADPAVVEANRGILRLALALKGVREG
jgi:glycosyltransferase involved in cell wall biosynthesis